MKTRLLTNLFILCVLLYSCADKSSGQDKTDGYFGVQIKNYLPTGSGYVDSAGGRQGYRSIIVDITNDTLVPFNLKIEFPGKYIDLYPSKNSKYKVFILPDSLAKEKESDSYDSINKPLKLYLDKVIYESSTLEKVIKPGETYSLRLGFLISPDGITRAELFSKGHALKLSIPNKTVNLKNNKDDLDLMLGITLDKEYSTISCGQISFSN
ncbi:MAG: hypothetical protein ACJ77K_17380 [Bacteroidia bacterium]